MGFKGNETYAADIETVFAMLCDPAAITARFEAAGDTDIEVVRCEAEGDGFVIETTRTVTIDLPGFARKVLSPTNEMTQIEKWGAPDEDGAREGTFNIEVAGAPARTEGRHQLRPDGDRTTHTIQGEMEVKVPLIGKKLGSFLSGTASDAVAKDLAFNRAQFD
jgi:hypothetical protein